MKFAELKNKTTDELETMLTNLKKEAFNLRFQRTTGELANTARVRDVRRTIAKIYTLFNDENAKKATVAKPAKAKAEKKPVKETKAAKTETKKAAPKKKAAKE